MYKNESANNIEPICSLKLTSGPLLGIKYVLRSLSSSCVIFIFVFGFVVWFFINVFPAWFLIQVSVYKTVFIWHNEEGERLRLKENVQLWLTGALNDPIVKILSKNSQLTKTQLETLLIDVLAENMAGKQLKYDEKASLRLTKAKLSRGAFNRTLKQSKENVIKSIYTVLLLGYLGVFETTTLDPYLEIANKLKEYVEEHSSLADVSKGAEEHLRAIELIREELEMGLKRLSDASESYL